MDFELRPLEWSEAAQVEVDALVVVSFDGSVAAEADGPLQRWIAQAQQAGDLGQEPGQWLAAYRLPEVAARRVVAVRAGDGSPRHVRQAVAAGWGALQGAAPRTLGLVLPRADEAAVTAAVLAIAEASYRYTTTLSKPKPRVLERVLLGVPQAAAVQRAFEWAAATVHGVELAKEWANRPANHARPADLAAAAEALAGPDLDVEVLGPKEVERLGMGALLAVARGSREPLRFIVLRYQGAGKRQAPVALIGKGITFDTGGISLKPAAEMDEMKFDMSGAAAVLGVFATLAQLRPAVNVVGLIPACENMPDGGAIKPGDVVRSLSGQTIEILNTDAEGRLILCDALTYAQRFKPRAIVDVATLTGACVIALGGVRSGLFASDDALAQALLAAGEAAQDPCWRLPLDDEYAEALKSRFADVANVGGRPAGAVTAAKFLQRFAGDVPWAHLDIAGTAWKGGKDKGATGRPVPLLVRWLLEQQAEPEVVLRRARRGARA
ncbi:Cytosol aminopeptidase [Tepidimonas alkaliphilus]|uniref:Probable cytosol aminopeptidase n=1 Tax=Tepidimonas alkaliphilus TaxID=2588942 RepID=A0A554WD59_9BURK|nr:leucyl aminopeptidase [Tepidimonas alkaliphilus]TSE21509.1 Cytosol aminopeptidase [Tepidimonas alkaliphilus]